jgi:hypothetical protein
MPSLSATRPLHQRGSRLLLCTLGLLASACLAHGAARAAKPLTVALGQCTEFVGIAPVGLAAARAMVPARYTLQTEAGHARLVVRVADCASVAVGPLPGKPGRMAHIGLMIDSPDGTGTDPNTSINNYTLSYASNLPALVLALRAQRVAAVADTALAYEFTPAQGPSEFYTAVAPEFGGDAPRWSLHGGITTPAIPSPFLANWWAASPGLQTKMATTIPLILFDFSSQVAFYTARGNAIGQLIGANAIGNFPLSFRGAFDAATMVVTQSP